MRAVKGAVMTIDANVIVVGLGVGGEFVAGRLADAGLELVGVLPCLVGSAPGVRAHRMHICEPRGRKTPTSAGTNNV
jgi:hypothetical protein